MSKVKLTKIEKQWCKQSPIILRELASIHDCYQSMTDAVGHREIVGDEHERRGEELEKKAQDIEDSY